MIARRGHPHLWTPLSTRLSQISFALLISAYLVVSSVLVVLLSVALEAVAPDRYRFGTAMKNVTAAMWGSSTLLETSGLSGAEFVVSAVATALGVLLPVVLLGAFVFKLFQHDPLTWRARASLISFRSFGPTLVFRCYNRTRSDLVDVTFRVTVRIQKDDQTPLRVNRRMRPLAGMKLVDQADFPLMEQGVPTGFRVPLIPDWEGLPVGAADIVFGGDRMPVPLSKRDVELKQRIEFIVIATGTVLATGATFKSSHTVPAEDLTMGNPQDIDMTAGKVRSWRGWPNFDGTQEIFIFAYGSLVNVESFARTLEYRPESGNGPYPALLRGYQRKWNVAYPQPEGKFLTADGSPWSGTMVAVGIAKAEDELTPGAVYRVTARDLWLLDQREDNYDQQDVTDLIVARDVPPGALVYTYVPTVAAKQTAAAAKRRSGDPDARAVVRRGYVELIRDGYLALRNRIPDADAELKSEFSALIEAFPKVDAQYTVEDLSILPSRRADGSAHGEADPPHFAS